MSCWHNVAKKNNLNFENKNKWVTCVFKLQIHSRKFGWAWKMRTHLSLACVLTFFVHPDFLPCVLKNWQLSPSTHLTHTLSLPYFPFSTFCTKEWRLQNGVNQYWQSITECGSSLDYHNSRCQQLLKDPKSYNLGLRFHFEKMALHTTMTKIDDGSKQWNTNCTQ